jgi:hypothetical protein
MTRNINPAEETSRAASPVCETPVKRFSAALSL